MEKGSGTRSTADSTRPRWKVPTRWCTSRAKISREPGGATPTNGACGSAGCGAPRPSPRPWAAAPGRPAFIPLPASVLRLLFGQLADEGLLASIRVRPAVLLASGYRFRHPGLEACLRHVLGRAEAG